MQPLPDDCEYCFYRGVPTDESVVMDGHTHLAYPLMARTLCGLAISPLNFTRKAREGEVPA